MLLVAVVSCLHILDTASVKHDTESAELRVPISLALFVIYTCLRIAQCACLFMYSLRIEAGHLFTLICKFYVAFKPGETFG